MKPARNGIGVIAIFCLAVFLAGGIDQATKDALKVGHILRTIESSPPRTDDKERFAEVTQRELNAYIAFRLKREKKPIVNRLTLDLQDDNHVQGKVSFDAEQLNLSVLLGDDLDFDFNGIIHTRDRAAKLDLIALYLGGYPVKPQVLDFVLGTAAQVYGTDTGSIDDWYALPKGIERIAVKKKKALLYF